MGHHLTADGQFKSDRHPDLPAGKIVLSFRDPHAQLGLWVTAFDYRAADPELSEDIVTALAKLGSAPPRCFAEDAWAWSIARAAGVDPRRSARVFLAGGTLHIVGSEAVVKPISIIAHKGVLNTDAVADVAEHTLVALNEVPPRSATDDGRPDFSGFLNALRVERSWSAMIHSDDKTGQAASDQRALHELAEHVERVGRRLGLLSAPESLAAMWEAHDATLIASDKPGDGT